MKQIFTTIFLCVVFCPLFAQKTYIWCGNLIDGISNSSKKEMTIVVEKNSILRIESGFATPEKNDKLIDLKTKTVTPGWIDMHVHIESEQNPNRYLNEFTQNSSDIAFQSTNYAEASLNIGFTSVRDLGGSGVNISLRNAINKGIIKGPRIFTAGKSIASTGGHADPTNGYRKDLMGDPGPNEGVVNSPEDGKKAVRQRYKDGSDLIKITATGGVLSVAKNGSNPQFTEEEIKAIVETANDYNMKVAAHAHGAEGMKRAIRAGVHSIEHGSLMDDETIELFKKYKTWYVPTLTAGQSVADSAKKKGFFPEIVAVKAIAIGPQLKTTFEKAYKAGVKIAFGTDGGVYKHGLNWREFIYMTESGMPAMDAIKAATINAAELLGMKEQLGSIEVGKLADIVAMDGDPLQDAQVFGKVVFVMKDGIVYKNQK